MEKKAIIVGAGLVGSLWSIFLAQRGYQVDIYERRGDMRKDGFVGGRSINLAMSTRGWKALEKAGVAEQIKADAVAMNGRMMHAIDGTTTYQAYGKEGQAIYSVSRGGLNLALINIADKHPLVNFHFDHKVEKVNKRVGNLTVRSENGERAQVDAPLIFGTDGAFSSVRSSLQRTPRFDYQQDYLDHGYKELEIPAGPNGTFLIEKNALHIWPRGHFMLIALPNSSGSFTCTLFLPFEGEQSFEKLDNNEAIHAFFKKYFNDALELIPELVEDFNQNPTSTLVTIRCNPWTYNNKFLLLGDASHAIVPFYGQGMNSGFEDCTVLDEMVTAMDEDWPSILKQFNTTRIPDANAIADLALRNFVEMRDQVGDPDFLLRKKIAAWLANKYPERFIPMYSQVTFTHIPYSKALAEAQRQDLLFEKILAVKNIHQEWQTEEVIAIYEAWEKEVV